MYSSLSGLVGKAQAHQQLIQRTVCTENDDPSVQPDERAGPERDHEQQHHALFPLRGQLCHKIAERIADGADEQCAGERQLEGLHKGVQVHGLKNIFVVVQCELVHHTPYLGARLEAEYEHIHQRPGHEHQREQVERQQRQPDAALLFFFLKGVEAAFISLLPPPRPRARRWPAPRSRAPRRPSAHPYQCRGGWR